MIEGETIIRKWGNSLGFTLPKDLVEREKLKEKDKIRFLVVKDTRPTKKIYGLLKGKIPESTQAIKDELRRELYDD